MDYIELNYEDRFFRRKKLTSAQGKAIFVDLPHAKRFAHGEQIDTLTGMVEIRAMREPLLEVRGDLARLAWHIGNRHTPCQIEAERLLIAQDDVLEAMLKGLGAKVIKVIEPFHPEGGAYASGHAHGHHHG